MLFSRTPALISTFVKKPSHNQSTNSSSKNLGIGLNRGIRALGNAPASNVIDFISKSRIILDEVNAQYNRGKNVMLTIDIHLSTRRQIISIFKT